MLIFFFFFFQAEDGIRDFHVTGVQTCALPISCAGRRHIDGWSRAEVPTGPPTAGAGGRSGGIERGAAGEGAGGLSLSTCAPSADGDADALNGVVGVAADVPLRLQRLLVAGGVARTAGERVLARRRVPVERPAAPCPRPEVVAQLGGRPGPAVVDADLDALDPCRPRPGTPLENAVSRLDGAR